MARLLLACLVGLLLGAGAAIAVERYQDRADCITVMDYLDRPTTSCVL